MQRADSVSEIIHLHRKEPQSQARFATSFSEKFLSRTMIERSSQSRCRANHTGRRMSVAFRAFDQGVLAAEQY
jgi:hypothetical protein